MGAGAPYELCLPEGFSGSEGAINNQSVRDVSAISGWLKTAFSPPPVGPGGTFQAGEMARRHASTQARRCSPDRSRYGRSISSPTSSGWSARYARSSDSQRSTNRRIPPLTAVSANPLCSSSKRILRNASRHCGSLLGASGIIVPMGGDVRPRYLTPWIAIPDQVLRGREQAEGADAVHQRMEVPTGLLD